MLVIGGGGGGYVRVIGCGRHTRCMGWGGFNGGIDNGGLIRSWYDTSEHYLGRMLLSTSFDF